MQKEGDRSIFRFEIIVNYLHNLPVKGIITLREVKTKATESKLFPSSFSPPLLISFLKVRYLLGLF